MCLHIVAMMANVSRGLTISCAALLYGLIYKGNILNEFITSDHKPIYVTFKRLKGNLQAPIASQQDSEYYSKIMMCITSACKATIPYTARGTSFSDLYVPGWNDVVEDKHHAARAAFLDWVAAGRPRHGPVFMLMSLTRAAFKLALRYCRDHEEMLRANAYANGLASKDFRAFWNGINKQNNANSTKHATVVLLLTDVVVTTTCVLCDVNIFESCIILRMMIIVRMCFRSDLLIAYLMVNIFNLLYMM